MQCQICGDTGGPFEIIDYRKRVILACEICAEKNKKERKIKNETAHILRKRHAHRISRTNSRNQ